MKRKYKIAPVRDEKPEEMVKASAHCAAFVAAEILGANLVATSGLGSGYMGAFDYNSDQAKAAMRIFGTEVNCNPDPYLANFTYNLFSETNEIPSIDYDGGNTEENKAYAEMNWSARPFCIANDLLYGTGVKKTVFSRYGEGCD